MRALIVIFALALISSARGADFQPPAAPEDWKMYKNEKYRYYLRYPPDFEVRLTGPAGKRDGATLRIARKSYAAPAPVLDLELRPRQAQNHPAAESLEDQYFSTTHHPITLNNLVGVLTERRFKPSGELAQAVVALGKARFTFTASSETQDYQATEWWQVVMSFGMQP